MNTKGNVIVRYASGMLGGQVVAREWKGRPYLANRPKFPRDREFTEKQMSHQERFEDATAYGKALIQMDQVPEIYRQKAESAQLTAYNIAIRDFLKPPVVRDIDVDGYTGKPGEEIVVRARDDTEVIAVHVVIRNGGNVVEEGDAVQDQFNPKLWSYVTVEENGLSGTTIEALATDRPGNVASGEVEL